MKNFKVTFTEEVVYEVEVEAESHAHINKMFRTGSPLIFEENKRINGGLKIYSIENLEGEQLIEMNQTKIGEV